MKVYSCPDACPAPTVDYAKYDAAKVEADEAAHRETLKVWLRKNGYPGDRTGEIVSFGVADGSAQYMLAEGRSSVLIHLPYGDAYQYRDVQFLPKKEILRRIDSQKGLASIFAARKAS